MEILLPYIKATNALSHKILLMSRFEPVLTTQLLNITMEDLKKSLQAATCTYFTSKYQAFQNPYLLQDLQDAIYIYLSVFQKNPTIDCNP